MPNFCIEWKQDSWGEYFLEADNEQEAFDKFSELNLDEISESQISFTFDIDCIYEVEL